MDYEKNEELSTSFLENILLSTSPYSDGSPDLSHSPDGQTKDFDSIFEYTPPPDFKTEKKVKTKNFVKIVKSPKPKCIKNHDLLSRKFVRFLQNRGNQKFT